MDVIFYLCVSSLIACVFCYFIFSLRISLLQGQISDAAEELKKVGSQEQKAQEAAVLGYIKKINDFNNLFKNHRFASNSFAFMQNQTMPYIWFKQFNLDQKGSTIQLSGQADNMDNYSRQVANFEKNEYVKKVAMLSSTIAADGKVNFNTSLSLDPKIFTYLKDLSLNIQAEEEETEEETEITGPAKNNQKLITIFNFPLKPEVKGQVNQEKFEIALEVPYGTDITSLSPDVIISPGASLSPASGAPKSFTNPVIYKVTAEDGSSQDYKVSVRVLEKQGMLASSNPGVAMIVVIMLLAVVIMAAVLLVVFKKMKEKKNKEEMQIPNNIKA